MKAIVILLLISVCNVVSAETVTQCTARQYFLYSDDGLRPSVEGGPLPITAWILKDETGNLTANFNILKDPAEKREGRAVEVSEFSALTLGDNAFQLALKHLAGVTADERFLQADSYTSYGIKKNNGDIFVVIFSAKKQGKEVGRALMWTGGAQPVGICSEMDPNVLRI
jgi:hypothetical protein